MIIIINILNITIQANNALRPNIPVSEESFVKSIGKKSSVVSSGILFYFCLWITELLNTNTINSLANSWYDNDAVIHESRMFSSDKSVLADMRKHIYVCMFGNSPLCIVFLTIGILSVFPNKSTLLYTSKCLQFFTLDSFGLFLRSLLRKRINIKCRFL